MPHAERTPQGGLKQVGLCLPVPELRPLLVAADDRRDLEARRYAATGNRFCRPGTRGRKPVHCDRPACAAAHRGARGQLDGKSGNLADVPSAAVVRVPVTFATSDSDVEAAVEQLEDALLDLTADYARGGGASDPSPALVVVGATLAVRTYRKDKR